MGIEERQAPEFGRKFIYTLAEAATILEMTPNKLLQFMANGVVNGLVYFGVINSKVRHTRSEHDACDEIHITFQKKDICENNSIRPNMVNDVNTSYSGYLGLSKVDAKNILLKGSFEQKKFVEILHQSPIRRDLLSRNRRLFTKNFHRSICQFPFYSFRSGDLPISGSSTLHRRVTLEHAFNGTIDSVYLDLGEILFLMRNYYLPMQVPTLASIKYRQFFNKITSNDPYARNRSLFDFKRKSFHSQKLVDLVQVSIHFWGSLYFEFDSFQNIEHPRNEVQEYLVRNYGFNRTLAKTATKIIFPSYAKRHPDISVQLKYFGLAPYKLNALIKASEFFYSTIDVGNRLLFPSTNAVEEWFKEKYCFPSYVAIAAAEIIEPTRDDIDDFIFSTVATDI